MGPFVVRPFVGGDQPGVPIQEYVQSGVGQLQVAGLLGQALHPGRRHVVGAPRGADIGRLPFGTHQPVALQGPERTVYAARVAIAVVHRTKPGGQLVAMVGLLSEKQ
jgi:hypothetical protein